MNDIKENIHPYHLKAVSILGGYRNKYFSIYILYTYIFLFSFIYFEIMPVIIHFSNILNEELINLPGLLESLRWVGQRLSSAQYNLSHTHRRPGEERCIHDIHYYNY